MSVVIADHLGIEGRGGEAVGQLCIAGIVGPLLHVDVGGSDDQQGWGSLEHTHTSSDRKWAHSASKCTNLQFLDVWDPEVHQVFLLAFLVMAVAELRGARIHLLLAGQVLHAHTRHTAHTPGTQLTHQAHSSHIMDHSSHTRHTAHTPGTHSSHTRHTAHTSWITRGKACTEWQARVSHRELGNSRSHNLGRHVLNLGGRQTTVEQLHCHHQDVGVLRLEVQAGSQLSLVGRHHYRAWHSYRKKHSQPSHALAVAHWTAQELLTVCHPPHLHPLCCWLRRLIVAGDGVSQSEGLPQVVPDLRLLPAHGPREALGPAAPHSCQTEQTLSQAASITSPAPRLLLRAGLCACILYLQQPQTGGGRHEC